VFWSNENKFLVVHGRRWKQGQPAANLGDQARAIFARRELKRLKLS